ncbi:YbgA family protein [Marinomonas dokdonensis]|uniref:YbgA family protein n=1 Tax=Marinomonas dokdonensis TaxID=328224 RepID=UPI0040553918
MKTSDSKQYKMANKIPVGISACLVGDPVRFNGGHSRSSFCDTQLSAYFDYQKFCPEMAAGFGSPRPTLRLEGNPEQPRMVFSKNSQTDVSKVFMRASEPYIETLSHLDGYIVMKKSPSCGMERIKVYQENGHPHMQRSAGLFTKALQERYPLLPIEEDGRLNDPKLRENFILRVFTHHDFRHSVGENATMKDLIAFHSRYKYLVMAHSYPMYKALGKMLSGQDPRPIRELRHGYFEALMKALSKPAKRTSHCNALMHIIGYLKDSVDVSIRKEIIAVVEQYRRGEVNLATPMTLLHHYLKCYGSEYIKKQQYFMPYPAPLGIRNTV